MTLKIVLIDTDSARGAALEKTLQEAGFRDVLRIASGPAMAEEVERAAPDMVIVDMALPDRDALEHISDISAARPIVMFSDRDDPASVDAAIAAGVCSYNLSGVATGEMKMILAAAVALFRRYRKVEEDLASARAALEERSRIERAKAILMRDRKMSEPEAYRWLQKKAMNESRKLSEVVAEFLRLQEGKGIKP